MTSTTSRPIDFETTRQAAVARYRLEGAAVGGPLDPDLQRLAGLAVRLTGADVALINVIDGQRQVAIASTMDTEVTAMPRSIGFCQAVVTEHGGRVVVSADASRDPRFQDLPVVAGPVAAARFYAGVPLVADDGSPLGAVCVVSMEPVEPEVADRAASLIEPLRDAVMSILEERHARVGQPVIPALPAGGPISQDAFGAVDRVLDGCLVQSRFEPVVELATGETVGFAATTHGPADSPLADPAVLAEAARVAGRLGDLDWLGRASAFDAALRSGLPSTLTWFVPVAPAGVETPCPQHLVGTVEAAQRRLRVVLALGKQELEDNLPRLLPAASDARRREHGVALTGIGERPAVRALLPFFQPDVVVVDLHTLTRNSAARNADIVATLRAYAERTGAAIMAAGVDDQRLRHQAVVLGARYVRGALFGTPGSLPTTVREGSPVELQQHPVIPVDRRRTPFEVLADYVAIQRVPRRLLSDSFRSILRDCRSAGGASTLLAVAQAHEFDDRRRFWDAVTEEVAYGLCLVPGGTTTSDVPRAMVRPLPAGDRIGRETGIAVLAPHYAGALFLRSIDGRTDTNAEVEFVYTHSRDAVKTVSRAVVAWMPSAGEAPEPQADTKRQKGAGRLCFLDGPDGAADTRPVAHFGGHHKGAFTEAMQALLNARHETDILSAGQQLAQRLGGRLTATSSEAAVPLGLAVDGTPLYVEAGGVDARQALLAWLPTFLGEARSVHEFLQESFERTRA